MTSAYQQKMLKYFFKFLFFDPISISLLLNLQNIFILPSHFHLSHFKNFPFPLTLKRRISLDHMSLLQTVLEFIENLSFCTF